MKLRSFSLQNYRSITAAQKIPLGDLTVLVGPNNEGKSNLLSGLVTGMRLISALRPDLRQPGRLRYRRDQGSFDFDRDTPLSIQNGTRSGPTRFDFEFELTVEEVAEFKKEIKSNLNGLLPVRITVSRDKTEFSVPKRGPGKQALTQKRVPIGEFVQQRLSVDYIGAVRTADQANDFAQRIATVRLALLRADPEYVAVLQRLEELERPILEAVGTEIATTLREFIVDVARVEVVRPVDTNLSLRQFRIQIDDGELTDLSAKGDGVQSLAALALARAASSRSQAHRSTLIAIEEPEAHLHSGAVHAVKRAIAEISRNQQVVIATHSPVLVSTQSVRSNIIVRENIARPAASIFEVKEALGIQVFDNLSSAQLVLLVEGDCDATILSSFLRSRSHLGESLDSGALNVVSMGGASKLSFFASLHLALASDVYAVLDGDAEGRAALQKVLALGMLAACDASLIVRPGYGESELEDLIKTDVYSNDISQGFGVDFPSNEFRKSRKKWSVRMEREFNRCGRMWEPASVKAQIAQRVQSQGLDAIYGAHASLFDTLLNSIQSKLSV